MVCEGRIINAHKAILSRCPYFDAMLRMSSSAIFSSVSSCTLRHRIEWLATLIFLPSPLQDSDESDITELVITDTSYDILRVIMSYLYSLTCEDVINGETAIEVLITAEKYGLDELKLWCERLILLEMEVRRFAIPSPVSPLNR